MRLKTLFKAAEKISGLRYDVVRPATGLEEVEIAGICTDSRKLSAEQIFVAIKGTGFDAHDILGKSEVLNCTAVVVHDSSKVPADFKGVVIQVADTRLALDSLAAAFFQNPSAELFCVGVTGTNGKTSTTYLIECILNQAKMNCGVLGTVNHHLVDPRGHEKIWPTEMTTPDPLQLQARLSEMKAASAKAIAMEVSSHALDQHRADAVQFDVAVFSNLTLDHLDYHKTMDDYFAAKALLFECLLAKSTKKSKFAVLNEDSEWTAKLNIPSVVQTIWYGSKARDVSYEIKRMDFVSTEVKFKTWAGNFEIVFPMSGVHNLENAMSAIAVGLAANIKLDVISTALQNFSGVPGRMQLVNRIKRPAVLVDYAHTPDALENVLNTLNRVRQQNNLSGEIYCVFGCGGDRDKSKRPLMFGIARSKADRIFVTSDNPRTEDPSKIVEDILAGQIADNKKIFVEIDREKAIQLAISMATSEDVVLIAGKGHEDYQIIGTTKVNFSDFEKANQFLSQR